MGAISNPLISAFKSTYPTLNAPAPLVSNMVMPSTAPAMDAPVLPTVTRPPTQTETDTAHRNYLINSGDGISQIKNPLLRGIARTGDILGSVFAPGLAMAIPGTTLHHDMQVNQQDRRVAKDQAQDQAAAQTAGTQAQTRHVTDEANALENPRDKFAPIQTDAGLTAFDPSTGQAKPVLGADGTQVGAPTKQVQPHLVTTADGNVVSIAPDEKGNMKATTVYEGTPKQQTEITKLDVNGEPHTVIVDKSTGKTVKDLGKTGEKPPSVSVSTGSYSMAQVPDGQGGMKTVLLNSKTGEIKDAPAGLAKGGAAVPGVSGTVADKNRTSLAHIAMNNLDHMQEIITRRPDLLGPAMGRISSVDQLLGSDDPDLVALGNEVHNFAMANAGIHGSRSFENVRAGEEMLLNHLKNGSKGIMGGIQANRDNLNEVINMTEGNKGGAGQPKDGDTKTNSHGDKIVFRGGKWGAA